MKYIGYLIGIVSVILLIISCATGKGGKIYIEGIILDESDDTPVVGAIVSIAPVNFPEKIIESLKTNKRGKFSTKLNKGAYTIWVSHINYFEKKVNKVFEKEINKFIVKLDRKNILKGYVFEPDGTPAHPVIIKIQNKKTKFTLTGSTNEDGSFEIRDIPSGLYIIEAKTIDNRYIKRGEKLITKGLVELEINLSLNINKEKPVIEELPSRKVGEGGGTAVIK